MNLKSMQKARRRSAWGQGRVLVTREVNTGAKGFRRLHAITFPNASEAQRAAKGARKAGSSFVRVF